MAVKWRGKQVAAKMLKAEIRGINVIMARSVKHAKQNHPDWQNRTVTLERSIGVAVFARRQGSGASGIWGSQDVVYARVQELGSAKLNIHTKGYLRPAAAIHYPSLPREIRRAFA